MFWNKSCIQTYFTPSCNIFQKKRINLKIRKKKKKDYIIYIFFWISNCLLVLPTWTEATELKIVKLPSSQYWKLKSSGSSWPQKQQLCNVSGKLCNCSTLCCFFSSKTCDCTLSRKWVCIEHVSCKWLYCQPTLGVVYKTMFYYYI